MSLPPLDGQSYDSGMALLDGTRIIVFLVGFAIAGWYLRQRWKSAKRAGEKTRTLAMFGALFTLALSRLTHLGQPFTWELIASIVIFALMAHSIVTEARDE